MQTASTATRARDAKLVAQLQAGDVTAFTELVRCYQDRIYNTVWRIVGDVEDARDVTQEVFLKAYQAIDTFAGRSSFYTWLFRIAVNFALSGRRQKQRQAAQSLDGASEAVLASSQGASLMRQMQDQQHHTDPVHRAVSRELQSLVWQAMQQLDPDHRAVVVLRDIEGQDYRQIAEVLNVPAGTVKSRLYRARMALRQLLEPALGSAGEGRQIDV